MIKRKGDGEVLTRAILGEFESGSLDPHRQVRRHVGLAHTRWGRESTYFEVRGEVARNSRQKAGFTQPLSDKYSPFQMGDSRRRLRPERAPAVVG